MIPSIRKTFDGCSEPASADERIWANPDYAGVERTSTCIRIPQKN